MYRTSPRHRRRLSASRPRKTRLLMVPPTLLASLRKKPRQSMGPHLQRQNLTKRRTPPTMLLRTSTRPPLRTKKRPPRRRSVQHCTCCKEYQLPQDWAIYPGHLHHLGIWLSVFVSHLRLMSSRIIVYGIPSYSISMILRVLLCVLYPYN